MFFVHVLYSRALLLNTNITVTSFCLTLVLLPHFFYGTSALVSTKPTWAMHTVASAHPCPGFSFPVVFSLLVQDAQKQSWRWAVKKSGTMLTSRTVEKLTLHLQIPSLAQTRKKRVPRFAVCVGTRPLVITSMSWHVKDARAFSGRVICQLSPTCYLWQNGSHLTGALPLAPWAPFQGLSFRGPGSEGGLVAHPKAS